MSKVRRSFVLGGAILSFNLAVSVEAQSTRALECTSTFSADTSAVALAEALGAENVSHERIYLGEGFLARFREPGITSNGKHQWGH